MIRLNIGSGQRSFSGSWLNLDCRDQGYPVDILTTADNLSMFEDNSVDLICLHHVFEHIPLNDIEQHVKEWYRVLKPGGKLDIFVPDIIKLFEGWKEKKIDNFILLVNIYGAYQGYPTDLHRWGYNPQELFDRISCKNNTTKEYKYNWSDVEYINQVTLNSEDYKDASAVLDWYILSLRFVK